MQTLPFTKNTAHKAKETRRCLVGNCLSFAQVISLLASRVILNFIFAFFLFFPLRNENVFAHLYIMQISFLLFLILFSAQRELCIANSKNSEEIKLKFLSYFPARRWAFTNFQSFFVICAGPMPLVPKIFDIGKFATFLKLTEYPPKGFFFAN